LHGGLGNRSFGGVNNLSRTNFAVNRTNIGVNRFGVGGIGNPGFGAGRGFGGAGWGRAGWRRSFPNGGFGFGGFGPGWGFGGGFGGFGLGLLLGYGLGGWGYGGWGGGGWGGYGGFGGYGYGLGYACPYDWLYGGSLYGYGYSPYLNPYYSVVSATSPALAAPPYDYSQPLNMVSGAPAEAAADEAATLFSAGRDAFKQGNFALALQQTDSALGKNPNDTSLHEFRALCLFALGRYDEGATALYAVLSIGPGWDWPTLIGLYPNVTVYESHLRALERFVTANPQSASARFVLAYQYLTEGFFDQAANVLRHVVALKPDDTLSAKLLEQLQAAKSQNAPGAPAEVPAAPEAAAVNTAVPDGATITGTWTAEPNPDTRVVLTLQPGGAFHWQLTLKGQTRDFSGTSSFGGGMLTLVPDKTPPIVGRVSWTDPSHMTFRVMGDRPDAPGLSFTKSVGL
jgi:thioredoxin-like negative regulator of GroEL